MPAISLAALRNAILNELTHAAPVGRNSSTIRRFFPPARCFPYHHRSVAPLRLPPWVPSRPVTARSGPKVEKDGQNAARLLSGGGNAQLVKDARHVLLRRAQGDHQPVGDPLIGCARCH